ncbi:73fae33e-a859-4c23-9c9b-e860b9e5fa6c [Thermothielavioides terrestris]|uniref:73fae33e-a859-4c23-9c9b-e860b9e5fa6c n=1 Tax=Thermothielavioides terrestris TaxID=2587410 RepID=A0A3S4C830_9PEZI|nr:73fae33e-a859-4c23-9c9b-e860b9e5fa6c [Thermothielavioides terrestris]
MDPRDQTFITIHNLTPDANILFASDSILDILGYQPDEVRGKSAFDYFHPDEVPFARSIHSRGVLLDKAAVLHYARILSRTGQWVSCECCFTVVHNVLVASTSIYFKGARSERRARDAPQVRRIFSTSPRDPRYHMLEHLSPKFEMPPMEREPRAALILNRFTRNLTIMYATDAVIQILGLRPAELLERPFYECIQPNCLEEAERCLESAKANESIAYLRFWYKDPRIDLSDAENEEEEDEADDLEDEAEERSCSPDGSELDVKDVKVGDDGMDISEEPAARGVDGGRGGGGSESGVPQALSVPQYRASVVRRRPGHSSSRLSSPNGLFAAPWGLQPIEPYFPPELLYTFRPPFLPQYMPLRECVKAAGGPPFDQLMRSIRDVAVFAWAVTGINGTLASYGQGRPMLGAQPVDGLPVWEPDTRPTTYPPPADQTPTRADGASDLAKDPPFGRGSIYPAESPMHAYRTRHASLDEGMYNTTTSSIISSSSSSSGSRPALWGAPSTPASATFPYTHASSTSSGSSSSGYERGQYPQHRRPPLRPAFSVDALQDHARHQQQQASSTTSSSASSNATYVPTMSWSEPAAAARRTCAPSYGGGASAGGPSSSAAASVGELSGRGAQAGRYFW